MVVEDKKDSQKKFKVLFGLMLAGSYIFLLSIGISAIASSSFNLSLDSYSNDFYFFNKQFIAVIMCLIMISFMVYGIKIKNFKFRFNYMMLMEGKVLSILYFLSMLVLLLVPALGREINGAKRWLFGVQPSEFIKIVYILYCAKVFSKIEDQESEDFWSIVKEKWMNFVVLFFLPILIVLQKDLGTIIHYAVIFFSMLIVSKFRVRDIIAISTGGFSIALFLGYFASYRNQRIREYLAGMAKNLYGGGYQVEQSIIGLGNGGLFGVGFGNGVRKYNWLPEVHTDFIFSSLGEELGYIAVFVIIFMYVIILAVGISMAIKLKDTMSKFLTVGFTFLIVSQVLMNLYVVSGLMPVTGIPLPFISYGRSSLITLSIAVGLLLNINKYGEFDKNIDIIKNKNK
jgi:cell division protein FtsW